MDISKSRRDSCRTRRHSRAHQGQPGASEVLFKEFKVNLGVVDFKKTNLWRNGQVGWTEENLHVPL